MLRVRVRRGWVRSLAIGAALLLVAVGLVACTAGPVIQTKTFAPYLPARVTATSGGDSYDIHVWNKPYAKWNAASSWTGKLTFKPLHPATTPVIDADLKSGGSLPFGPFAVLDL